MTTLLAPLAVQRFYDNSGNPAAGGKVYTYQAGTSTPAATYTDSTGGTQNTNPITLNSRGEAAIWLDPAQVYKFIVKDALGNTLPCGGDGIKVADVSSSDLASSSTGKGSKLIAYMLRLTGAVARWVEDKFSESVSVLDFGAKGDGATDDTAAIQAAINSGAKRIRVPFAGGTYIITDTILIQDRDNIHLDVDRGVTFKCTGTYYAGRCGIKLDNANNITILNVNIRGSRAGWIGSVADIAASPIDFGIYSTSTGTGAAGNNRFDNVDVNYCRVAGFCIGNNDPLVIDETTDEHQMYQCSPSFCAIGIKIVQANTNMTRVTGGWVTDFTQYGIYIGNNSRGVTIDNTMFYTFASFGGVANIYVAKENSGPVAILNIVTEQYQGAWLKVEATSAGLSSFGMITITNANVTNNDATVGQKLIDYQGAGSVAIRNSRFGGAGSLRAGGVGAVLSFQPANAAIGGMQSLITEQVELYDGATWDVQTDNGTAWMRWIDTLSVLRATGVNSGSGDLGTPLIRERGRINHEIENLPALALASGGVVKSYGKIGAGWRKVTVSYTGFVANSTTASYYFVNIPAKCRIMGIYVDTTTAFAGLAGTITAAVKNGATVMLNAHDVKTAAVTKGLVSGDLGTVMTTGLVQGAYIPSWTGTAQLAVELVSGTGNVGNGTVTNLTAGSIDVYLLVDVPPTY